MRVRARETVVIGKSRPVVPKQLASVRLRAAFSDRLGWLPTSVVDRASSSWSRDSDLDLGRYRAGASRPRPALIVHRARVTVPFLDVTSNRYSRNPGHVCLFSECGRAM